MKLSEKLFYGVLALSALLWTLFFAVGLLHIILCAFGVSNASLVQKALEAGGTYALYGAGWLSLAIGAGVVLHKGIKLLYNKRDRELFSKQLRELWK